VFVPFPNGDDGGEGLFDGAVDIVEEGGKRMEVPKFVELR